MFIEVEGENLDKLNNEAGGHRIQRNPPTERKGRVHTSTVTVAVIDPMIQKIVYKEADFKVEWFSGTGAGGQNRNKVQNSCKITHIQSGIMSTAQTRSRTNSLNLAKNNLLEKLKTLEDSNRNKKISSNRKEQVGSGMRGDKIRTYRFQDDIVKDHITGKSASVKQVLKGNFDLLW